MSMECRISGALARHVSWQEHLIEGMVEDRETRVDARLPLPDTTPRKEEVLTR